MNPIKWILNWLGAGSPRKENVTGAHQARSWSDAEKIVKLGYKVSRFKEKPVGWFVEWDDVDKVFREGRQGSKTRKLYVPEDNPADMVSCDWYIL